MPPPPRTAGQLRAELHDRLIAPRLVLVVLGIFLSVLLLDDIEVAEKAASIAVRHE